MRACSSRPDAGAESTILQNLENHAACKAQCCFDSRGNRKVSFAFGYQTAVFSAVAKKRSFVHTFDREYLLRLNIKL